MNTKSKKSVSLVEILAASLILTFIAGGFISVFIGVRRHVRHAHERATATSLIYSQAKNLLQHVDQSTWDDPAGPLADGSEQSLPDQLIDNIFYTGGKYEVEDQGGYRKVTITYQYPGGLWQNP